jgi:PKD domain
MSKRIALPALILLIITLFATSTSPALNPATTKTTTNTTPTILGPTAAFTYNPCVMCAVPGDLVMFDASWSKSPTGTITLYAWNFGDNTPIQNTTNPTTSHDYFGYPSKWIVSLTVTDSNKQTGAISQQVLFEVHPVFTYHPSFPLVGQPILFNATASISYNGTSPIQAYLWTFGDGTTGTGSMIKHTYNNLGLYRTTLELVTSFGNPQISETVIVTNTVTSPPIFTGTFKDINVTIAGTISYDTTTQTLTASLTITATNMTNGQTLYTKTVDFTRTYPPGTSNPRFILAIPLSTTSLGVRCAYRSDTATVNCMITKNPDLDQNGTVDLQDISAIVYDFGSVPGSPHWDPNADLAGENAVDLIDVSIAVYDFGTPVFT